SCLPSPWCTLTIRSPELRSGNTTVLVRSPCSQAHCPGHVFVRVQFARRPLLCRAASVGSIPSPLIGAIFARELHASLQLLRQCKLLSHSVRARYSISGFSSSAESTARGWCQQRGKPRYFEVVLEVHRTPQAAPAGSN